MYIAENDSREFNVKAEKFIDDASKKADLLLTPEGCFPWGLLEQILNNKKNGHEIMHYGVCVCKELKSVLSANGLISLKTNLVYSCLV
jgi:hypothetical protein